MQIAAEQRGEHGGRHRNREGRRVAQAMDMVHAHSPFPISEKQLHFPANSVKFGDIARSEDGTQVALHHAHVLGEGVDPLRIERVAAYLLGANHGVPSLLARAGRKPKKVTLVPEA